MIWPTKKLGDNSILEMTSGGTPSRSNLAYYNGDILWLKSGELNDNQQINDSEERITEEAIKNSSAKIFPINTVLFAMYGATAGKLGILSCSATTNQAVAGMICKENILYHKYLYYFLFHAREKIISKAWGGAQPNLSQIIIKDFEIPLPSITEQKKIVAKLERLFEKTKEAKRLRVEAQEAAQNLLSAELHKIFEEGKKKGWEEKELGQICKINPQKSEIKNITDRTKVSFVPMSAVDEYLQSIVSIQTKDIADVRKGYTYFKNNDVLFAKITPCMENGKVAIARNLENGIGFGTTEFHVIRPIKNIILSEWIYAIVRQPFFREDACKRMTGSAGQKRVPKEFLEKYKVLLPPLAEQKKIVAQFDSLAEKIKKLQKYQKSTTFDLVNLEQSILSKAFSGELVIEKFEQSSPVKASIKIFPIQQAIGAILQKKFERGEMVIDKVLYMVQEIYKVPLLIPFTPYKLGPWSIEVKKAITGGLTKESNFFKKKEIGKGYVLTLGSNSQKLFMYSNARVLKEINQPLDDLLFHIRYWKSPDIECLATVCKIIQDSKTIDLKIVQEKMEEWKPGKFSNEQIKKTLDFIITQGWDKVLLNSIKD